MSSKRKLRSENTREARKRQATEEKEVISLLELDKEPNNTSDAQKQDLESIDNAKNNTSNNESNSNKTEQDNTSKKEEDPQCGICLDKPTVQGKLDSCTHIFCFECIEHWSKTANTCPFCKARFKQLTKIDLQNPENNKKMKKVRVRHADQRPEYDDPEEWIVYEDDDEFDDEDGWIEDDMSAWGMPWPAPQSLPGNFWTQFLAGSLPEAFEADVDEFIDDGPDDFIDLTDEPDDDLFDYEDEPNDDEDQDIGNIDISALVREVFHPYSRLAAPAPTTRRRSTSSRIRTLRNQMRNTRSQNANNSNNTNNRNTSNNNNNNRSSSTQRNSGAISERTRSHSANNSNNRTSRSNSRNQRTNTNNGRRS